MRILMRTMLGLALLGLLAGGLTLARADDKKDDKDKKEKKADRPDFPFPDIDKLLEQLGGGLNEEQLKELRKRMQEMREKMMQMERGGGLPLFPGLPGLPGARLGPSAQEARLGVSLREPSATLIDQLDLPRDQGMVLHEVRQDSAAAKAGLKAHDILLEVAGKAVPSKKDECDKLLAGVESNKEVEAVVMRKGKKETVKGLTLPEAKALPRPRLFPGVLPGLPGARIAPGVKGESTSVTRQKDFTTKHRRGVNYVIKGKINQGKAFVSDITIESGGQTNSYDSVDKVPMEHQEKVKKLVEMSAGGKVRVPGR
jgi:serine protease Do